MDKPKSYTYMTLAELQAYFKDSWVLLLNSDEAPTGYYPKGGYFVYKHKKKAKVMDKLIELNKKSVAKPIPVESWRVFYTGEIKLPENHILCL